MFERCVGGLHASLEFREIELRQLRHVRHT
jgi:hypothetical protein